jgi:hypothetical protein
VRREGRKVLVWGEVKTGRGSGESKYYVLKKKMRLNNEVKKMETR